ncbi:MAG: MFS transporter [Candidatus Heimdallarchaeota archaeon]
MTTQAIIDKTTELLRIRFPLKQKYRNLIAIGLYGFLSAFFISLILTYYNTWYLRPTLGLDETHANTIFSYSTAAGSVGLLLTVIIGGAFSDDFRSRYGARAPFILAGTTISGATIFLVPIAGELFPIESLIIIFPGLFFIIYVGLGLGSSPAYALMSELFTRDQRGWVGLILAGFTTIGSFAGIIVLRAVIDNYGIIRMFFVTGILFFICGLAIFFLVEKVNPPFEPIDPTFLDIRSTPKYLVTFGGKDFGKMLLVQSLWGFAVASISMYLIIHLSTPAAIIIIGEGNEGIVLIVTGVIAAIAAIPAGLIIQRIGKVKTAMAGSIIYAIYCFGTGLFGASSWEALISLAAIAGLGAIFIESVRISLPADLVPEGKEAQFMGINQFASSWTQPLVGLLGAQILNVFADNNPTLIIFVLAGTASLLASGVLFFIEYEKMILDEYKRWYKRFLVAKGVVQEELKYIVNAFK